MGHDHHFLSRLDRVNRDQVDFALALYRDHERTAWILNRAHLPGEPARVALAIEAGPDTPHVIVTRDGHFVTCLGPGMSAGSWPVVSRTTLDGFSREHETHRGRHLLREKLEAERRAHGTAGSLFDRIFHGEASVSREEFLAISAFSPLMTDLYANLLAKELHAHGDIVTTTAPLFARARKAGSLAPQWIPTVQQAGRTFWGIQHMALLFGMHVRDLLERQPHRVADITRLLAVLAGYGGLATTFVRGSWAIANIGPVALPVCRALWYEFEGTIELAGSAAALASLALRHPALEPEVKALLRTPRTDGPNAPTAKWIGEAALLAFDPAIVDEVRNGRPVDAVVEETLGTWSTSRWNLYEDLNQFTQVVAMLPFAVRAEAEQFYLPRERVADADWSPSHPCWLLATQHAAVRRSAHARKASSGPSRNGPCTCGSGKKYKRCCGADARQAGGAS
jgi:hypothetical protein